jgi:tetratricopeptide (TPR) repeat protein
MAKVLDNQGKYEEALQTNLEVNEIQKRVLGPEHPDTLNTRNNMALVLHNQGKYEEELQAYLEVQPGYEINNQLFVAVKNGDIQWVRDCIRGRANVDARDNNKSIMLLRKVM